ncbi:helicase associated domain-containing protein [Agathobacter rectalis]|uniref:helicase associated domain-containing protein n=1 Tax=Agathobacter rectalis TaxID=39491 RepID=UPI002FE56BED
MPLGRWLSNQTNSHSMTDEQLQRLQSIGYRSESKTAIQWNRKFELAKAYYEKNGNLDVPVSYSTDGVKLGRWISNIRCKRKNRRPAAWCSTQSA